jgi:hypothetical protein
VTGYNRLDGQSFLEIHGPHTKGVVWVLTLPALAEAVGRPFESFSSEEQAEMLKRLDYEGLSTPSPTLIPN